MQLALRCCLALAIAGPAAAQVRASDVQSEAYLQEAMRAADISRTTTTRFSQSICPSRFASEVDAVLPSEEPC